MDYLKMEIAICKHSELNPSALTVVATKQLNTFLNESEMEVYAVYKKKRYGVKNQGLFCYIVVD